MAEKKWYAQWQVKYLDRFRPSDRAREFTLVARDEAHARQILQKYRPRSRYIVTKFTPL